MRVERPDESEPADRSRAASRRFSSASCSASRRRCGRCRRAMTSWRRSIRSSGCLCSAAPSRASEARRRRRSTARRSPRELERLIGAPIRGRSPGSDAMPSMSRRGSRTRPPMRSRSNRRSAMPPGRRCRRRAGASTGAASCSRCRTGSTCTIWCRSRPSSATASRCCGCPRTNGGAREGFALTDPGTDLVGALDQANYCIWCHNQGKDCCSKGLKEKDGALQEERLRRHPRRLPARGEDLRDEPGEGARQQPSARSPSSPSTTRCAPAPGTASATTA